MTEEPQDLKPTGRPKHSPQGTTVPRHIAAILDGILAPVAGVIIAKSLVEDAPYIQAAIMIVVYVLYFFLFEWLLATTPGKFLNRLRVEDFSGGKLTFRQALVRTLWRILEVNPFLLGAVPAAWSIIKSEHKQRYGDKNAGTVVVFR